MDHRSVLRLTKYINKGTLRLLAVLGMVMAGCIAVTTCLGAVLMVRQLQLISAQRKALPTLRKAAEVYLRNNAPEELPAQKRRKAFTFPKATPDIVMAALEDKLDDLDDPEAWE